MTVRKITAVCIWLVLAATICATPVKIVGPSGPVPPYTLIELQAEGDLTGAAVLWDVSPDELADVRELPGGKVVFTGPPGNYRITCTVVRLKDGQTIADRQRFKVTIGTPVPPVPPVPPEPPPDDGLTKTLRAAYAAEADGQKAGQAAFLASVYRGAGVLVDRADITTNKQLLAALHTVVEAPGVGLKSTQLMVVRNAVADYLDAELGKSASAPVDKAKARAAFARVAASLEALR